jgi:PAS domain S-box-containing protein
MEPKNKSVAEGGRTDELPQDRLWFLEGMDRVNQAIQDTEDLQQTTHVLDAVLSIFGCDRAWIVYPCDPDSQTCRTVADCARPAFAHSVPVSADVPIDAPTSKVHRLVRASDVPVCFGAEPHDAISDRDAQRPVVRSQICLAIYPKIDEPYMLGLDQCTHARSWTGQEQRLFAAIGHRIATLLTSLLLSRDLQESKARLEEAQRVAHVGYWDWNIETNVVVWSDETYRIFGVERGERPMDFETVRALVHPEDREALYSTVDVELDAGVHPVADFRIVTPGGEVRTVHAITSKLWSALPGDPGKGKSGKTHRLFGTVQDITELRRAEEAR